MPLQPELVPQLRLLTPLAYIHRRADPRRRRLLVQQVVPTLRFIIHHLHRYSASSFRRARTRVRAYLSYRLPARRSGRCVCGTRDDSTSRPREVTLAAGLWSVWVFEVHRPPVGLSRLHLSRIANASRNCRVPCLSISLFFFPFLPSQLRIYEANFASAAPADVLTLSRPKYDFTRSQRAKYARVVKLTAFP